jgi:hypothetical protein
MHHQNLEQQNRYKTVIQNKIHIRKNLLKLKGINQLRNYIMI